VVAEVVRRLGKKVEKLLVLVVPAVAVMGQEHLLLHILLVQMALQIVAVALVVRQLTALILVTTIKLEPPAVPVLSSFAI
jgi:hypothetical protein